MLNGLGADTPSRASRASPRSVLGVVGTQPKLRRGRPAGPRHTWRRYHRLGDGLKQYPLLYRFRAIDRLPEGDIDSTVRGSVVHARLSSSMGYRRRGAQRITAGHWLQRAWDQMVAAGQTGRRGWTPGQPTQLLEDARVGVRLRSWPDSVSTRNARTAGWR